MRDACPVSGQRVADPVPRLRTLATMRTRQLVAALVLLPIVGLVGCNDEGGRSAERATEIVAATIRHVAAEHPPADDADDPESDHLPVVYVVSVGEEPLSAGIQADVVAVLRDEIDVRFSDDRGEAIDGTAPTEPVKDGGVLVVLGAVPKLGNPVQVPVEVYIARHEHLKLVFTFAPSGDDWDVTQTSEVPLDAV